MLAEDELIEKVERIRASLKLKTKAKSQCASALKTYSRGVESALQVYFHRTPLTDSPHLDNFPLGYRGHRSGII